MIVSMSLLMDELCDEVVRQLKSSFDRFGDDLSELILSFLPFEDKIRFECVSKQWQSLIYNKQFKLGILKVRTNLCKSYDLPKLFFKIGFHCKTRSLESVLKKCPNIRRFDINLSVNHEVLAMIGELCPRLKSFDIHIQEKHLLFAEKYCHKLEELELWGNDWVCKKFLEYCPNLKKTFLWFNYNLFDDRKEFLPNLEIIDNYFKISSEFVDDFKKFCEKYSKTLKKIYLDLNKLTDNEMKTCLVSISQMKNLKSLKLLLYSSECEEPIDEYISMIGQNCSELSKLILCFDSYIDRPFKTLSAFKSLISLYLEFNIETYDSIECLSDCSKLKHLDIINPYMTEDMFTGINTFLPNLQIFKLNNKNIPF